jgi:hypothetical protein
VPDPGQLLQGVPVQDDPQLLGHPRGPVDPCCIETIPTKADLARPRRAPVAAIRPLRRDRLGGLLHEYLQVG